MTMISGLSPSYICPKLLWYINMQGSVCEESILYKDALFYCVTYLNVIMTSRNVAMRYVSWRFMHWRDISHGGGVKS